MDLLLLAFSQLLWGFVLGFVLLFVVFFVRGFARVALRDLRAWNGRRLDRARRYRAVHGTSWSDDLGQPQVISRRPRGWWLP